MDRWAVYDGETPQTVDFLNTGKVNMVGQGFAWQALLGTGVCVNGLACTQTSPLASTSVTVAPGSIYQQSTVDATAYGDLNPDANIIVKQGILYNPMTLTPVFTGIAGQSQVFLVEVQYVEEDDIPVVVQYFNASDPQNPLWGATFLPSLSGGGMPPGAVPQNTSRSIECDVQLKAGTPATTGSQVAPTVDAGWIGLFTITLAFGYTNITNANIAQVATAPFFPNLPAIPGDLQTSLWTYAVDTGTANAYVATVVPAPIALVAGLLVQIKITNGNTAASTLNLNGLGAKPILRATTGLPLSIGDLSVGEVAMFAYDGNNWQLVNYPNTFVTNQSNTFSSLPVCYVEDHGKVNHLVVHAVCNTPGGLGVNVPPGPVSSLFPGLTMVVKAAHANTGPVDIAVNNIAPVAVVHSSTSAALEWFAFVAGELLVLVFDGVAFRKMPKKNKLFQFDQHGFPDGHRVRDEDDEDRDYDPGRCPPFFFPTFDFWPFLDRFRTDFREDDDGRFFWPRFRDQDIFFPEIDFPNDEENRPRPKQPPTPASKTLLPIALGDIVNITFENVKVVQYNIAVSPGIYEVEIIITATNSNCCDFWHCPNDELFEDDDFGERPFQCFPHRCHEDKDRNFLDDVRCDLPRRDRAFGRFPCFEQHEREEREAGLGGDDEDGPDFEGDSARDREVEARQDAEEFRPRVHGQPPFFITFTFVTFPFIKHIRCHGGCFGGPFHHHCDWDDRENKHPWTSLGSFVVGLNDDNDECPNFDDDNDRPKLATISGVAIIRRLA